MRSQVFVNKSAFLSGLAVFFFFGIGCAVGYVVAANSYKKAIAQQAAIDISRQLTIALKLKDTPEFKSTKNEIDINIHRHLLQVMHNKWVLHDEHDTTYKNKTLSKLADYWRSSPPFQDEIDLALAAKNDEMANSLKEAREFVVLRKFEK